jgi:FixJ family two-component response regulator
MNDDIGLTVAVVDDDAVTLGLVCSMLHALGHRAIPFQSAAQLVAARRVQVFHALVLDLSMPDVDGFELIYQLAEQKPVEPVVIMSSRSADIIQVARLVCQSLGIHVLGVLSKPFAGDELHLLLSPYSRLVVTCTG